MRDLTEKELALAPDWATHYRIGEAEVLYESNSKWLARSFCAPFIARGPYSQNSALTKLKPIPRKPFDISGHDFSDEAVSFDVMNSVILIDSAGANLYVGFNKADAIAIAKALGVKGSDL
jgi:hypothetical protein